MKSIPFIIGFLCVFTACNSDTEVNNSVTTEPVLVDFIRNPKETVKEGDISVAVYDFENFKPFLNLKDDQIHVVNFWATWCIPCVAELPYFEQLGAEHPEIEVLLVSLDFPKKIQENLIPFIQKNKLKSEVLLLDEPDANSWIPQVDPTWSGAIPATIIYKNDESQFYEQSFNFAELEEAISSFTYK